MNFTKVFRALHQRTGEGNLFDPLRSDLLPRPACRAAKVRPPSGGPAFAPLRFRVAASKWAVGHTYIGWARARFGLTNGCLVKARRDEGSTA
jgi:hypothetical protein